MNQRHTRSVRLAATEEQKIATAAERFGLSLSAGIREFAIFGAEKLLGERRAQHQEITQ